jgi:F-type H+-transporting ATPase subunit a
LELISEFSKILSFAFRLFGNIFAGSVLLFVMGFLLGKFSLMPTIFYMLEFFVGAIQALVFGLLTMTFMAQATQGHDEHPEKVPA